MAGPLAGLRVVDCSRGIAGTRASGLLADYGADVVWVEPPSGDPYRDQLANFYAVQNRGKRSISLDLTEEDGHRALLGLLEGADVFLSSWRPGVAERLRVDYAALHPHLPRLVHTTSSGFGPGANGQGLPGHEALVHALVGTMGEQRGYREGPIFEGLPFASLGAASLAVIGTLAALYRRFDDHVGRSVETSLLDGALAYLSMGWSDTDTDLPQLGSSGKRLVVGTFQCGDGQYLGVHTGAVGAFGRLMRVLGVADRIAPSSDGLDMAWQATPDETAFLQEEMPQIFAAEGRAVWLERLSAADVCAVPVLHPGEVFDEPQAVHNRMVVKVEDPCLGPTEQVAPPARFSRSPWDTPKPAPTAGEHGDVLLQNPWGTTAVATGAPTPTPDTRPVLAGLKILDFGAYYAGPYASRLLADLGAQVIKVETLAGDPLRGQERVFPSGHAGKRSIALDMKDPEGQAIGLALAAQADVVQHNLRPGAAERLGLGYDQIVEVNPEVIYAYSPGWGSTGPDHRRQGFAPMYSGYVGVSFEVAGQRNPPVMPSGNEDPGNGLVGAMAILMALYHRRRTGEGQLVEHPQLNATMAHLSHIIRRPDGSTLGAGTLDEDQLGTGPLDRLYRTADGWICLSTTPARRADLAAALGIDLTGDAVAGDAGAGLLAAAFAGAPTEATAARLSSVGIGCAVPRPHHCRTFLNDPENVGTGRAVASPHPVWGTIREVAKLVRVGGSQVPAHRRAPVLGEHTDEILAELDHSTDDIAKLRDRGIVR